MNNLLHPVAVEGAELNPSNAKTAATPATPATPLETGTISRSRDRSQPATNGNKSPPFLLTADGVYLVEYEKGKEESRSWMCSPLEIVATTRDSDSANWGFLLKHHDRDSVPHEWPMPAEMLKGSGEELRGELLRQGLQITSNSRVRNRLGDYIQQSHPKKKARCVQRTGWHDGVYVFPNKAIGPGEDIVVFQAETTEGNAFKQRGSLEEWQQHVSILCVGNSRLTLALSVSFASMLIGPAGIDSGGFHFRGASSEGKTRALLAASSVFGDHDFKMQWRATDNGLESVAVQRNDSLLILDELGQIDPRVAGEVAYMLANGVGKVRANRKGGARDKKSWRLLFLSAGEISLSDHMRQSGKKAMAGQEIRMLDIPANAGAGHGLYETLHHFKGGAELSDALSVSTGRYYGTAALAFLEKVIPDLENIPETLRKMCAEITKDIVPKEAGGQVQRAGARFAIVAASGELATRYGITGWPPGEAIRAAKICFTAWLESRGTIQNKEVQEVIMVVKHFLEAHGESRFTVWDREETRTINRAGFRKTSKDGDTYYVLPEAFKQDLCEGIDPTFAAKVLKDNDCLELGSDDRPAKQVRLPSIGSHRCYVITPKIWEARV